MSVEQVMKLFPGLPEQYATWVAQGLDLGQNLLIALVIFGIGWWIAGWAHRSAMRAIQGRGLDIALGRFLAALLQWTLIAAAAVTALQAVGIEVTSLVAIFASAGIAVGLALQGSLSHFASGVMLLVFRPFTIDDVVEVAGSVGRVDEIGLFATTLITLDNRKVIIPNGSITGTTIVNMTALGTRRADIGVGVAYGEDPARVERVLLEAASQVATVRKDPEPAIAFTGMGASAIEFTVMVWCDAADYIATLGATRTALYNALNSAGIEIPFDQIVIHQADAAAEAAAK